MLIPFGLWCVISVAYGTDLQTIDVCDENPSLVLESFHEAIRLQGCRVLHTWDVLVASFAPERFIIGRARDLTPYWDLPRMNVLKYNYVVEIMPQLILGHSLTEAPSDSEAQGIAECQLTTMMVFAFIKLVHFVQQHSAAHLLPLVYEADRYQLLPEFIDENHYPHRSISLMNHVQAILQEGRVRENSVSIFGMLQWLSTILKLQKWRHTKIRPCHRPPVLLRNETSWHVSLQHLQACFYARGAYHGGFLSKSIAWMLSVGQHFWAPLHLKMAKEAGQEAYLLSRPQAEPHVSRQHDPEHFPLVELCATQQHQKNLHTWSKTGLPWSSCRLDSPVMSAVQPDHARLIVVAVATGILPMTYSESGNRRSNFLLEFVLHAEKPSGECVQDQCDSLSFHRCRHYAAILPEASMRKWRCIFSNQNQTDNVEASAVVIFRQAATLRCPVPLEFSLDFIHPTTVWIEADPPHDGLKQWQLAVKICPQQPSFSPPSSSLRLAVCIQPLWDIFGLERRLPKILQTFLRYHHLLGAEHFTIYDYDDSLADHPEILTFLAAGKLKYFPSFPKAVSELMDAALKSGKVPGGHTGSISDFVQELYANQCLLNYRGRADFVLIGSADEYLALGPSSPTFASKCWPRSKAARVCCSGGNMTKSFVYNGKREECWEQMRSFSKCCLNLKPTARKTDNPWQTFLQSHSPRFWRNLGSVQLNVCEYAMPTGTLVHSRGPKWYLMAHLWRPNGCGTQFYHLINPWRVLSQNREWIRLQPGASRYIPSVETARVLHLVNLHRERCTEFYNNYGYARTPCLKADFALRWAIPGLAQWDNRTF